MQESYKVTARKWRPRRFSDVTSQEFITTTLKNSIKNNRISHAYLFSGPRGVGKTTVARLLAKAVNCLNPQPDGEPCNDCNSCLEINNDNRNHPDVFEIDGASNRNIEDVRELKERVKYGPIRSRYKIFIIDEVHMLTSASFNALLKTLEEPPEYIVFIFATTAPEKVPLTILGRCQKFDFKRLTAEEIIQRLKYITDEEKIKIDEESLFFISKKGDGSMRDAQGLLDIATAYCGSDIKFAQLKSFFNLAESDVYFKIMEHVKNKKGNELLLYFDELMKKGYDMQTLLEGLQEHLRNLLVVKSTKSADLLTETESVKKNYMEFAEKLSEIELINSLKLLIQTEYTFKYSSNQRILFEVLLIELTKFADTKDISAISDELRDLKKKIDGGTPDLRNPVNENPDLPAAAVSNPNNETPDLRRERSNPPPENGKSEPAPLNVIQIKKPDADAPLEEHWEAIKEQIKNEKRWIYSLVRNCNIESGDRKIFLMKTAPEQYEMLNGYEGYLNSKIVSYFGSGCKFSFVLTENGGQDNFEKICDILVKDFNGKVIENE